MNLIPSNNLKEIILTEYEYELITDQIRLKSDHYLDFYNSTLIKCIIMTHNFMFL